MKLQLDIQHACADAAPAEEDMRSWIELALEHRLEEAEISLRLVDEAEMRALNLQYRLKDTCTNVLSFPADLPAELQLPLLGDIVICPVVVEREAVEQHKSSRAHWAHMLVHGSLHLLGYDHIAAADAEIMESLETTILQSLGWPCPYAGHPAPVAEKSVTQ